METFQVPVMELLGAQARLRAVDNLERMKANIAEYGFLAPVMLGRDRQIAAGCEQFLAACALGWDTVPCVLEAQLDEDERAYCRALLEEATRIAAWDDLAEDLDRRCGEVLRG